ncbi:carbonic anhydrase [Arcanobacterium canis]
MSSTHLQRLLDGNARFVSNTPHTPAINLRQSLVAEQHPFAAVVACADSRVAPEIIFDQPLGAIFTVRTAGHVLDSTVIASLAYAVDHLGVEIVVVVGHESCGAVQTALQAPTSGCLSEAIVPVLRTLDAPAPTPADVERAHARATADTLRTQLNVPTVALRYQLASGKVEEL